MMHQSTSTDEWSFGRILSACWRFKWRGILAGSVVIGLAIAALLILPKVYASEAKLFVRLGRENMGLDPTATTGGTVAITATRDTEMNSILEHLHSTKLLEEVLSKTSPGFDDLDPVHRQLALNELDKSISVDSPRGSTVIIIHLEDFSPTDAQAKLQTFVDAYLADHIRINRNLRSHDFFEEQSSLLKHQLADARNALRDAKTNAGIASIDGKRNTVEGQIDKAELRLQEVEVSLSAVAAEVESLETSLQDVPEELLAQFVEGTPNDGLAAMRQRLFELRTQEKEILSKFTPSHPEAIAISQLVADVEQALSEAEHNRANLMQAVLARKQADEASLMVQQGKLRDQLVQLTSQLKQLNENEALIGSLSDEVTQLESKYLAYVGDREQARLDEALRTDQITNVSILQEATISPLAIRPQKATVLLLAGVIGMLAGLGIVLTSEQFNPSQPSSAAKPPQGNPRDSQASRNGSETNGFESPPRNGHSPAQLNGSATVNGNGVGPHTASSNSH
ncbi:GNVR domain-containing protein [Bremerella sp. JC817]|uniref:GumC family protein n=1 Tax=Bremerella sp. JC817 TaxID=3231756 RepID=UPI00345B07FB